MPLILRKIRRPKWYKADNTPWLTDDDLQADAMGDLQTQANKLSVWRVMDDKSNFEQIISAISATWDRPANFDYALFDMELLDQLDIKYETVSGDTPYKDANKWHIDLVELTASKLYSLAKTIHEHSQTGRVLEKKVKELLIKEIEASQIDVDRLKDTMRSKLGI